MESLLRSDRHDAESLDDAIELCFERGWTDGLPVVPPTPEKVARFVEASGRKPDEVVCEYPSRNRVVSVEKVAINAVMAGCRPEYLPVVLAIVEAMGDEAFGLHAANATTGGSAVGFVVNGPVRKRLGMNFRGNVLGPGNRANSTIGRAVRLTQINAMGSVPGAGNESPSDPRPILDRTTVGQPGKYAGYHIPENEEDYPALRPLHVERGFAPEDDVVTVFASSGHIQISVHAEPSAESDRREPVPIPGGDGTPGALGLVRPGDPTGERRDLRAGRLVQGGHPQGDLHRDPPLGGMGAGQRLVAQRRDCPPRCPGATRTTRSPSRRPRTTSTWWSPGVRRAVSSTHSYPMGASRRGASPPARRGLPDDPDIRPRRRILSMSALQLLDPTTQPVVEPGDLAPRLDALDGKTIGLYANMKLNAVELLDEVESLLSGRFRAVRFVRGSYNAGRLMRPEEWQGVDECDAVVLTHGD